MHPTNFSLSRLAARIGFVRRCLKNRSLVEQVLDERPFYAQCAAERDDLKSHFYNRLKLRSLPIDEGTMLFGAELKPAPRASRAVEHAAGTDYRDWHAFRLHYITDRALALASEKDHHGRQLLLEPMGSNAGHASRHDPSVSALPGGDGPGRGQADMDKGEFFDSYRGDAPALVFSTPITPTRPPRPTSNGRKASVPGLSQATTTSSIAPALAARSRMPAVPFATLAASGRCATPIGNRPPRRRDENPLIPGFRFPCNDQFNSEQLLHCNWQPSCRKRDRRRGRRRGRPQSGLLQYGVVGGRA